MIVSTLARSNQPAPAAAERQSAPPYAYALYLLRIHSDFRLPLVPRPELAGWIPDLEIRRGRGTSRADRLPGLPVAIARCRHGRLIAARYQDASGPCWAIPAIGRCRLRPDVRQLEVLPEPGVDEALLGLALVNQVLVLALHAFGYPCLLASALTLGDAGIALLGPAGVGKSAIAAHLARQGGTLLADGSLPLWSLGDGIYGAPGLPLRRTDRAIGAAELGPSAASPGRTAHAERVAFVSAREVPLAPAPAYLRALYLLERYDPSAVGEAGASVRALAPRDAVAVLAASTAQARLLTRSERQQLGPLYARLAAQAPLHVLRFPAGSEHDATIAEQIRSTVEPCSPALADATTRPRWPGGRPAGLSAPLHGPTVAVDSSPRCGLACVLRLA